ncbi:MAG: XdhC family protein, partial [Ktedonobacteraceae bacterium]|nr:XdhC family protein [Ktedonobacteraceae bacterium]
MNELYEELRDLLDKKQGVALATVVGGPEHIGAKLLVFPDQTAHGTLGLAELDERVRVDAQRAIWNGDASITSYTLREKETQQFDVFIEGFPPPPTLIIVGAGHIAIPLT